MTKKEIIWYSQQEFWQEVNIKGATTTLPDNSFTVDLKLEQIRGVIPNVAPTYTPEEDEDFPGPVERWYGKINTCLFIMTFDYCLNTTYITHENSISVKDTVYNSLKDLFNLG